MSYIEIETEEPINIRIVPPRPKPDYEWEKVPRLPWRDNTSGTIKYPEPNYNQPCLIEEFFKRNPGGCCMISCPCPRCNPYCMSVANVVS